MELPCCRAGRALGPGCAPAPALPFSRTPAWGTFSFGCAASFYLIFFFFSVEGGEKRLKINSKNKNTAADPETATKVLKCQDGEDGMRGKREAAMAARRVFHLQPCGERQHQCDECYGTWGGKGLRVGVSPVCPLVRDGEVGGDAGSAMRGDGMQWDACWCPALGRGFLGEESGRNLALRHCFGDFYGSRLLF